MCNCTHIQLLCLIKGMKTEIEHSYKPREGYIIDSVLTISKNVFAIFSSKYKSDSFLEILKDSTITQEFNLSRIKNFNTSNYYKSYFIIGNEIGLMHYAKEIVLFNQEDISRYEIINISNPFEPDSHGRELNANINSHLSDNQLLFGLDDYAHYGFPPRFISELSFKTNSIFGLNKKRIAKWDSLFELPKEKFPETEFHKFGSKGDWLNIRTFYKRKESLFIHSTGGSSTRLKSGTPFEFNIIAEFDTKFNWIKNHSIQEGYGNLNSNKDYFIFKVREKRNKIIFYDSQRFNITDELSLTPKQNLGSEKITRFKFDKVDENFILYNAGFFNICKIIN